jgi:hypothetical protein
MPVRAPRRMKICDDGMVSVKMIPMKPRETIERFDRFLVARGLSFEAVVIGGTALGLLGVIARQTRDCDILHPQLTPVMLDAAQVFAVAVRAAGDVLDDQWLNNGPSTLVDALPVGWQARLQRVYTGEAIVLHSLGRQELLMSKLFALCDREIDLQDCLALSPTVDELQLVTPWLEQQDAHPDWPAHIAATLDGLRRRLRHGV